MMWTNRLHKWLTVGGAWTATVFTVGVSMTACLARPVGKQPPTTKVNFTSTVSQQAVDKVDLLFAIDNSASMGDKQVILSQAVPNLVEGLLKPKCLNAAGAVIAGAFADPSQPKEQGYGCGAGNQPEFKPVIDMHIGIVSSSLGNFGGDVCPAGNVRSNDRSHLINAKKSGGSVTLAQPLHFLAWFPQTDETTNNPTRHPPPQTPIRTIPDLESSFTDLVVGVDQTGCGLEAQLESVYRFLNQPDPWDNITLVNNNRFADLGDRIDDDVLAERADFLRPDSLVAIIMLTDEDDSSSDPLSLGGQGWAFMARQFPGSRVNRAGGGGTTAPRGTKICETDPGNENCRSCGFQDHCDGQPWCAALRADVNCRTAGLAPGGSGFDGFYGPTEDDLNVRFHRMKQRFGIDPQYPIQRYIDGLTKFRVPDRSTEHVITGTGDNRSIGDYTGTAKCTNPLFAAHLPHSSGEGDVCNLARGTRSPDLIFFAVVGGVPNQLLYPQGYNPVDQEANRTTPERWNTILGRDSIHYDYTGISPYMIQSVDPRPGLTGGDLPRGNNGTDAVNGREWNPQKKDLQYACTFDLPPTIAGQTAQRTCAAGDQSCDCAPPEAGQTATNPPLCSPTDQAKQIKAKAYPTIREFEVARSLGDQGIASSLCPLQLSNPAGEDYGYKPAVAAIIDRLKNALTTQCLPQKLLPDDKGLTPCLVLAQLADESQTCQQYNMEKPAQAILDVFLQQQKAESGSVSGDGGLDLSRLPVCVLDQQSVAKGDTCKDDTSRHWCYVENDAANGKQPAGRCPQALIFSTGTSDLSGARFSLQCIQNLQAGVAAGQTGNAN